MNETTSELGGIIQENIVNPYSSFINSLPESYQIIFNIFIYVILIALYGIFVFEFYRFLARKNILRINLSKYNTSTHPFLKKFFAALFFLIEYVIILPVLVFFWFVVLAFMLLLLSESKSVNQVLLVSAAVVGAIRIISYLSEEMAKEVAKLFPLTVLSIFLLSPDFLSFGSVLEKLAQVPLFLTQIFFYLIFVIFFEIFIRAVYTLTFLFKRPEDQEIEEVEEAIKDQED